MKSARTFALALLAAAVCSAAAARHGREIVRVEVPFETVSGHDVILVAVTVAEKPAHFILDTGSELTMVDREFAGFTREKRKASRAGGHGIVNVGTAMVSPFCMGTHCLNFRKVGVGEFGELSEYLGRRIDGLLGQDVLRAFDEVTIDYKKSTVTFSIEEGGQ